MSTKFANVPEWPTDAAGALPPRTHNEPPLEERIVMDFVDVLTREGITERVDKIVASAGRAPPCTTEAIAGQYGDLVKMARAATVDIEAERERLNRPLLTAQRTLKAKADAIGAPMVDAVNGLRKSLDTFMAEERRKADEVRRLAEEQARAAERAAREEYDRQVALAKEEAEAAGAKEAPVAEFVPPPPVYEAPPIAAPVARGDLGSRVGTKTVWKHKIDSVRMLPDAILKNERVIEALDKVIAAQIRGGTRAIKGVTIWDEQVADVR